MKSLFVWIVLFAGAAIALLGVFLGAAEKELKKKRQELNLLLAKLEGAATQTVAPMLALNSLNGDGEEVNGFQARNQEIDRYLAPATAKLAAGDLTAEEFALAQRNVEIAQANAQWLQSTNDQLKGELDELKRRLQTSESHLQIATSQPHNGDDRQGALENEIAELQQQLAENRSKIRELKNIEHKLANVDAIEMHHREEIHGFEVKIAELENGMSGQVNDIESLIQRLADAERIQQTMRDDRLGIEQELARWQARAANAEAHSRQLAALQEPFAKLLAKQALLEERQREYQEALGQFAELVVSSDGASAPLAGYDEFHAAAPVESHPNTVSEENLAANIAMASPEPVIAATQTDKKPKRLFGLFPAIIVLAATGALAAGLWRMNDSDATAPATVSARVLPARPQIKASASPRQIRKEIARPTAAN